MLVRIAKPSDVKPSEITPQSVYLDRRSFMKTAAVAGAGAALLPLMPSRLSAATPFQNVMKTDWGKAEKPTSFMSASSYNNFYEFGTDKGDPIKNSRDFKPKPWSVMIDGLCTRPGEVGFDDLVPSDKLEERVYRLRCVEAWSMVIPWIGVHLGDVLKRFEPTGDAKFVAFETLNDPERMPNQKSHVLNWPYAEGLRIDEAMHPLTLLTVGMYGQELPNQNGAPLRLVVPWKYGFKSIKSIVRISFVAEQPRATWNEQQPQEYGFYSNVNPNRDHPRWSQSRERRIGEFLKRETLPFNGYAEEVAGLYAGMDLINKYF